MQQARWIVVGTDFSDGAQCAFEQALRLAGASGARIALVHAYEEDLETRTPEDAAPIFRARLAETIARTGVNGAGIRIESFVRRGAPWEKLLNVAVEVGADLIVVGATGQRGLSSAANLLGGVAYRVVASSTRSVLVSRLPADKTTSFLPSNQIQEER
jgi:nucleotide-binding universal stress UspA family protein